MLTRTHAQLVVRDVHVERVFEHYCTSWCVSDENYIPTLLASYNASHEVSWMCETYNKATIGKQSHLMKSRISSAAACLHVEPDAAPQCMTSSDETAKVIPIMCWQDCCLGSAEPAVVVSITLLISAHVCTPELAFLTSSD